MMPIGIIPFSTPGHFKWEILIPYCIYSLPENEIIIAFPDAEYIFRWELRSYLKKQIAVYKRPI